jgi:hypothetical protein
VAFKIAHVIRGLVRFVEKEYNYQMVCAKCTQIADWYFNGLISRNEIVRFDCEHRELECWLLFQAGFSLSYVN